jgi:hypothetical protein
MSGARALDERAGARREALVEAGPRRRELSPAPRPTFYNRAHELAGDLAGDLVRRGEDLTAGAFFAIDPRDRTGADLAVSELVSQGVTARQAEWALAHAVEEATRQNDVVVGISWCDAESLRETVESIEDAADWPARLAAPLPEGFVRLVMISEGRLTFSLVPYD